MVMQKIQSGYKQTEVGVIPEEWDVKRLGEIAYVTKLAGFEYSQYFNSYKDGGDIIVIRGTNITNNRLDLSDVRTIPRSTSNKLPRSRLFANDLVFAYVGTIGPVYLIEKNDRYHLGPNTCKIRAENLTVPRYLYFYFTSWLINKEIFEQTSIGAQPSLSMSKIRKFKIAVPNTIEEQCAIAQVLSDTDALIESLEKLIEKKENIKQGAMQELLSGKRRLPEFETTQKNYKQTEAGIIPEDWNFDKIENLTTITTGAKNTQDRVDEGQYPFFVRSQKVERIGTYSFDGEAVLTAGDGVGTGKVFHYVNGKFDFHQRVYKLSNFDDRLYGYFFYLYFKNNFLKRVMAMTAKSSVDSVRMEMIADMFVPLPEKKEQTVIAQVLSDMESEIEALEQEKNKYKQLKLGMMQQLLTGRIRLRWKS